MFFFFFNSTLNIVAQSHGNSNSVFSLLFKFTFLWPLNFLKLYLPRARAIQFFFSNDNRLIFTTYYFSPNFLTNFHSSTLFPKSEIDQVTTINKKKKTAERARFSDFLPYLWKQLFWICLGLTFSPQFIEAILELYGTISLIRSPRDQLKTAY